ncbi:MAG: Mu transposase C-terminal domain-containing protein [Terriglobia bacterium]
MIATLPSAPKGTAMVSPGRGVKINYIFYWCDEMNDPKIQRRQVPVRYDPFDLGTAYAFVAGRWVQCHSDHYRAFQGRTQKELLIASKELRAQNRDRGAQFRLNASKLAHAFASINLQESQLLQRLRSREIRALRERTSYADECRGQVSEPPTAMDSLESTEPIVSDGQVFERF